MARKELEEINAGSMADIAFLLLIFFLVTTTMDQDIGIPRMLPPKPDETKPPPVKLLERNFLEVLANKNDALLVRGKITEIQELKQIATEFYSNPNNSIDYPKQSLITIEGCRQEIAKLKAKNLVETNPDQKSINNRELGKWKAKLSAAEVLGGPYEVVDDKATISLKNQKGTSYGLYTQVQNELQAAVNDLRDELSMEKFGKPYSQLDKKDPEDQKRIKAIRLARPQRIAEISPKK